MLKMSDIWVEKLHSFLADLMGSRRSSARKVASLLGPLLSMSAALGPPCFTFLFYYFFTRTTSRAPMIRDNVVTKP